MAFHSNQMQYVGYHPVAFMPQIGYHTHPPVKNRVCRGLAIKQMHWQGVPIQRPFQRRAMPANNMISCFSAFGLARPMKKLPLKSQHQPILPQTASLQQSRQMVAISEHGHPTWFCKRDTCKGVLTLLGDCKSYHDNLAVAKHRAMIKCSQYPKTFKHGSPLSCSRCGDRPKIRGRRATWQRLCLICREPYAMNGFWRKHGGYNNRGVIIPLETRSPVHHTSMRNNFKKLSDTYSLTDALQPEKKWIILMLKGVIDRDMKKITSESIDGHEDPPEMTTNPTAGCAQKESTKHSGGSHLQQTQSFRAQPSSGECPLVVNSYCTPPGQSEEPESDREHRGCKRTLSKTKMKKELRTTFGRKMSSEELKRIALKRRPRRQTPRGQREASQSLDKTLDSDRLVSWGENSNSNCPPKSNQPSFLVRPGIVSHEPFLNKSTGRPLSIGLRSPDRFSSQSKISRDFVEDSQMRAQSPQLLPALTARPSKSPIPKPLGPPKFPALKHSNSLEGGFCMGQNVMAGSKLLPLKRVMAGAKPKDSFANAKHHPHSFSAPKLQSHLIGTGSMTSLPRLESVEEIAEIRKVGFVCNETSSTGIDITPADCVGVRRVLSDEDLDAQLDILRISPRLPP